MKYTLKNKEIELTDEEVKAYGVSFTPAILDTMTAVDNSIIWHPFAIFKTKEEAEKWKNEKWMGNADGVEIKEVIISYN